MCIGRYDFKELSWLFCEANWKNWLLFKITVWVYLCSWGSQHCIIKIICETYLIMISWIQPHPKYGDPVQKDLLIEIQNQYMLQLYIGFREENNQNFFWAYSQLILATPPSLILGPLIIYSVWQLHTPVPGFSLSVQDFANKPLLQPKVPCPERL